MLRPITLHLQLLFGKFSQFLFPKQVTESDAVDAIEVAIKRHTSDLTTKAMALIALLKLSSRFPSCSEYVNVLPTCILSFITHIPMVTHFYCLLSLV